AELARGQRRRPATSTAVTPAIASFSRFASALAAIDPRIVERARCEIRRRLIDPILAGATPRWTTAPNNASNWAPWCASSLIAAAGFACANEPAMWGRLVHRMLGVVDHYVNVQGADGGCDEGVMYWNVAGGCVVRALEEVRVRTGGIVDGWSDAKLREIMRFPTRMHLGNCWFPAFADCNARVRLAGGVLARAAERVGALELNALAWTMSDPAQEMYINGNGVGDLLQMQLRNLFWLDATAPSSAPALVDAWLPDLQVMVAHAAGTSLAVKGGHNRENHNHCDIGQFVIHRNGHPMLVDAGRGDYTAQTFGPKRYELWWTRGSGHAVPQIDGYEQIVGREHAARAVSHQEDSRYSSMTMDLAACYAATANLRSLIRTVTLQRTDGTVRLVDRVDAGKSVLYLLSLLTPTEPKADGNGGWIIENAGQRMRISGSAALNAQRSAAELDSTLRHTWSELWRLTWSGTLAAGASAEITIVSA
ncbi:MAG: heparinase II/III family protein, partial [Planctomycetota bacterium]